MIATRKQDTALTGADAVLHEEKIVTITFRRTELGRRANGYRANALPRRLQKAPPLVADIIKCACHSPICSSSMRLLQCRPTSSFIP